MKLNNISSNMLPEIDVSIKRCINLGQWLLFKSSSSGHEGLKVFLYLKAGSNIFCLDESGTVIEEFGGDPSDLSIDELFYFSDLPRPSSLSNFTRSLIH